MKEYDVEVMECEDYHDLLVLAEKRGYKRGWAYYIAKEREFPIPGGNSGGSNRVIYSDDDNPMNDIMGCVDQGSW